MKTIKTFRGLLEDGQQERIALQHIDGKTGYRIKQLRAMPTDPGASDGELIIKVFSVKQTVIDGIVNFSEQTLLGASYVNNYTSGFVGGNNETVIFDGMVFNQDIFVTAFDGKNNNSINYYLELETFDLNDVEATATILKNFRNTNTVA